MGEQCTQGDMDLTWQEIMSITELQGLDMHPESAYNTEYGCQPPAVQFFGYSLGNNPRDSILPNVSQGMPNFDRLHLEPISPQAQQVPTLSLVSEYGPTSYTGMLMSNVSQTGAINHYPSKLVPTNGMSAPDHRAMPDACVNGVHSLHQHCKGQDDFETDSGLSLNFSDGESIEIENIDTQKMQPDFMEIITPHVYQSQYHMATNFTQSFMEHNMCETQTYITSRTQELVCSRDERRAVTMQIPFPIERIINLPVEEFNELLSHYTLTESQLALVRDIRRRGKNKVAAQNCRKRKMENIVILEREIEQLRTEREGLHREREDVERVIGEVKTNLKVLQQELYSILQNQGSQFYNEDLLFKQTPDASIPFPAN
ncbi:PREDICTED: transcription factor NF-E2 45 kDa subunit [Nanorana parkeri]|uniref:transcription factor NF-E2 45 kDa subunit n=1 Tax=Nanorana parkeri TaxID=125878 RepID=UPI0008549D4F|nr:PREDICTED: transcription factor NF-E2 45 kDa subunit [Nanorana parkeri]